VCRPFYQCTRQAIERAGAELDGFAALLDDWHPDPQPTTDLVAGLRPLMAKKMDAADYEVVSRWPLRRTLVWMEESRVQAAFDKLNNADDTLAS